MDENTLVNGRWVVVHPDHFLVHVVWECHRVSPTKESIKINLRAL